jgi:AcrR family transcriptional regulator
MTKQLMKDALLELLEKQKLVNITVTAICETADVHRSTFYKYYTDPEDLLRAIEQDFLDRIPMPSQNFDQQNQEQLLTATTAYFDDVKKNIKAYRILLGDSAGSSFAQKLVECLCSRYTTVDEGTDALTDRLVRLYIANGTVGMLREWIDNDCPISSRKIAEKMYFLSRKVTY